MKSLKESILDDIETTMNTGVNAVIIDTLFDKDINKRRKGFEQLLSIVEVSHSKEHKTTAKMKNSDSYFVEFTWPLSIQNGEATQILDYISYMQICKRKGLSYRTTYINASENRFGNMIDCIEEDWRSTQPNFNPKASNTKLYEVPEGLNDLFKQIQMEAYNHR